MLSSQVVKSIEEFVYQKPRSIQEISAHIKKNWRTADRYVTEIEQEYGTIATRVFRGGTRGALKIVYWASVEKIKGSAFQEQLEKEIQSGRKKEDFSPFEIFQHVSSKNKEARISQGEDESSTGLESLKSLLLSAKKQVLIFSGNASFVNFADKKIKIFEVIEELVRKGISVKVISRVDIAGRKNIESLLSLNFKLNKELIEVRHRDQPLRAIVIDNQVINMKEIKEPTGRKNELNKKTFIFYTVKDREWSEWLSRIFWKMFSTSVDANSRFKEIEKIKLQ